MRAKIQMIGVLLGMAALQSGCGDMGIGDAFKDRYEWVNSPSPSISIPQNHYEASANLAAPTFQGGVSILRGSKGELLPQIHVYHANAYNIQSKQFEGFEFQKNFDLPSVAEGTYHFEDHFDGNRPLKEGGLTPMSHWIVLIDVTISHIDQELKTYSDANCGGKIELMAVNLTATYTVRFSSASGDYILLTGELHRIAPKPYCDLVNWLTQTTEG